MGALYSLECLWRAGELSRMGGRNGRTAVETGDTGVRGLAKGRVGRGGVEAAWRNPDRVVRVVIEREIRGEQRTIELKGV